MIVLLLACRPCPDGLARDEDGVCVSTGGPIGEGAPPTEALFLTRFDERFCDELEDCWCDAYDLETCDPSLDCPSFAVPIGCRYDELQAQACLSGRFDCDEDPDRPTVTAPDACSLVYDCEGGTGTGGTGSTP